MLKFCTNKPIWASLPRQIFFWGGEGGVLPQKRVSIRGLRISKKKKSSSSSIRIVSYCKHDMYFNKYDMYIIVGIDKKMYGEGIGITYIHT
jgi:hypothetical protein